MLEISLERAVCTAGRVAELVVLLRNPTATPLTNIRVRLALPTTILLLGGESIVLEQLPAGETARHSLKIKPQQPGEWVITSPTCSFRDALGTTYWIEKLQLPVQVVAAPVPAPHPAPPPLSSPARAALRQQLDNNARLISTHRRRLQKRREQLAIYGSMADPSISMEIEEITRQIARLESENRRLRAQLGE